MAGVRSVGVFLTIIAVVQSQPTAEDTGSQALDVCTQMQGTLHNILEALNTNTGGRSRSACGDNLIDHTTPYVGLLAQNEDLGFQYVLELSPVSWDGARSACVDRGYALARIESEEETNYIKRLIRSNSYLSAIGYFWIDGTDEGHEGCWVWTHPEVTKFEGGYVNWATGEPRGGTAEQCLSLYERGSSWIDLPCSRTTPFLCKRKIGEEVTSRITAIEIHHTTVC